MDRKKILGFAIGPIASALLGIVSVPVIAWYFSAEDIGRISMLQVSCDFMVVLFGLGLDRAYVREYHETASPEKPALLITAVAPGLLLLLAVVGALQLFSPSLPAKYLFAQDSVAVSNLVLACVLAAFLARYLSLILRMQEKGLAYSMSQMLPKMLFLAVIGCYINFAKALNFEKLIIAHSVSWVAVMLVYTWNTKGIWVAGFKRGGHIRKLGHMLSFGLPLAFASLASWALLAMDKLFLRSLSTYEELGIYSVAMSIASCAGILSNIFTTIWAPSVYKWIAEGGEPRLVGQVSEHVLAAATAILVLCGLGSWILAFFLPSHYANVQFMLAACMASILFNTLSETSAVGIGVARKSFYSVSAAIVAALANALGNYLLVPEFGAVGACVSTAVAFWLFLIVRTEFARLVWYPLPRLKLYLVTFTMLIFDIVFAFSGAEYQPIWLWVWAAAGLLWFFLFKSSFLALMGELHIIKVRKAG